MPIIVSKAVAYAAPHRHQFVAGIGYLPHAGAPDVPPARMIGKKNCLPPPRSQDGSLHRLKPPTGGAPLVFKWMPAQQVWLSTDPGKGNRLGWPAEYLMKAGWEYIGGVGKAA